MPLDTGAVLMHDFPSKSLNSRWFARVFSEHSSDGFVSANNITYRLIKRYGSALLLSTARFLISEMIIIIKTIMIYCLVRVKQRHLNFPPLLQKQVYI